MTNTITTDLPSQCWGWVDATARPKHSPLKPPYRRSLHAAVKSGLTLVARRAISQNRQWNSDKPEGKLTCTSHNSSGECLVTQIPKRTAEVSRFLQCNILHKLSKVIRVTSDLTGDILFLVIYLSRSTKW